MAIAQHLSTLPAGLTWSSWAQDAWQPGISPLVIFDPVLGGSIVRPVQDAQLLVFTSGPATGMMIRLIGDSSARTLTFPAGWVFLNGTAPSSLAANKTAILFLFCWGTTNSDVTATYAVQS